MAKNKTINVKGTEIAILQKENSDFISLTDMVKGFGDDTMIYSWMRNRNTLEFLGVWEEMNNPDFKGNEFVTFKSQAEGNIRDQSTIEQLLVLANMESMNAEFIRMELPQSERLLKLNQIAIVQLQSLSSNPTIKKLL